MNKSRSVKKQPEQSDQNNQQIQSQADHPDQRLRDLLQWRFPEGFPPSQSPNDENVDDKKDGTLDKRGKKRFPRKRQLPKPKEK